VTANQYQCSRDQDAAEYPIEFSYSRRDARLVLRFDFRIGDRGYVAEFEPAAGGSFFFSSIAFLNQRIPFAAFRTFPQPLAGLMPAILTRKNCFRFFQELVFQSAKKRFISAE